MSVLAAALLTAVALAASGCGGGGESAVTTTVTTIATNTNPTGTAAVTTHGRFSYPPVLVDNFMRSCTRGSQAKKAYCTCTLDKLSNTVSTQDFARIGLSGGKVPPRIRRAIKQAAITCADRL